MKIRFAVDSGANIHSNHVFEFDLEKKTGLSDEEWKDMSDSEQLETMLDVLYETITWAWEELP